MPRRNLPRILQQIIDRTQQESLKPVTKLHRPTSLPIQQYTARARTPIANGYGTAIVSAGPGFATPALAQSEVQGTSTSSPLALTLGSPTTAGNTLIVCVNASGSVSNPTVSGITIGGSASNFIKRVGVGGGSNPSDVEIWECFGCPGGQTAISISFTGGSVTFVYSAEAMEWSGLVSTGAFDQSSSAVNNSSTAAFNSGTTSTLGQANEVAIGVANGQASAIVVTGPAAPWTNFAGVGTSGNKTIAGYNIVTATTGLAYAGTYSPNSAAASAIATFKAAATGVGTVKGQATVQVGPQGLGTVWYPQSAAIGTTTGAADASTCQLYIGPLSQLQLISGTSYAGGGDSIGLGVPPITPGYYIVAVWSGAKVGDIASLAVYGSQDAIVRPAN